MATAQGIAAPGEIDWRKANETVGALKRGHGDILKWEQANLPGSPTLGPAATTLSLQTIEQTVRQAWTAHRDLSQPLAALGADAVQNIAAGDFQAVDPTLHRRVHDLPEVLELATQAKKSWIEAVAARQIVNHQRDALESAEAAHELGRRMVSVGNWSRLQQTQVQLAHSTARMNLVRAENAAAQAQSRLIDLLQLAGVHASVALPDKLPEIPAQALRGDEAARRLAVLHALLPRSETLRSKANFELAMSAYSGAHAVATISQGEVLAVRQFVAEEAVLHYNGMLKSVWNLLDEVRNQSQATIDAISAQRDFWLAEADLQWVIQGGAPTTFVSLGGAGGEQASAAGH
jgi:hypothetical protein